MKNELDTLIANSIKPLKLPPVSIARKLHGSRFVLWIKPADLKAWGKIMLAIRERITAAPFQIIDEDPGECSAVFARK